MSGVWISFSRHSPNWRVVKNCHSTSQKTNVLAEYIEIVSEMGKKILAVRLASGFTFLLANLEFYSHFAQ
jgi:hypothetical protein